MTWHDPKLYSEEVKEGGKGVLRVVDRRSIAFFRRNGKLLCVDANCFHMGGPLHLGDVEDLGNGDSCITCPLHNYKVSLQSGCHLSGQQPFTQQQRTHATDDRQGRIRVQLNLEGKFRSDKYAYRPSQQPQEDVELSGSSEEGTHYCITRHNLEHDSGTSAPAQGHGLASTLGKGWKRPAESLPLNCPSYVTTGLEPMGGTYRFPPSPVKLAAPIGSAALMDARRRKAVPVFTQRTDFARKAVQENGYAPPLVGASPHAAPVQRKLNDLWGRLPASSGLQLLDEAVPMEA